MVFILELVKSDAICVRLLLFATSVQYNWPTLIGGWEKGVGGIHAAQEEVESKKSMGIMPFNIWEIRHIYDIYAIYA